MLPSAVASLQVTTDQHVPEDWSVQEQSVLKICCVQYTQTSGIPRGGFGVFKPFPPPKFRRPSKIVPNSTQLWKLLKIAEFWTSTPQDVRKKGSKILKPPRFTIVLH